MSETSGRFKKACPEPAEGFVQQGHSHFFARSVLAIREYGKMARTLLATFFNRPLMPRLVLRNKAETNVCMMSISRE